MRRLFSGWTVLARPLSPFVLLSGTAVVCLAVFNIWPRIDIDVSALFFREPGGFWLRHTPVARVLRAIYQAGFTVTVVGALGITLLYGQAAIRGVAGATDRLRYAFFVLANFALGPGLITNALLKEHWGRARPADILEFGGRLLFTPAGVISNQCAHNCSFTSGEGAAIATTAFTLLLLLPPEKQRIRFAIVGAAVFGCGLRIATGRHFLSDTLFSVLISAAVTVAMWQVFGLARKTQPTARS